MTWRAGTRRPANTSMRINAIASMTTGVRSPARPSIAVWTINTGRNHRVPCRSRKPPAVTTTAMMKKAETRLVDSDVPAPLARPSLYPRPARGEQSQRNAGQG